MEWRDAYGEDVNERVLTSVAVIFCAYLASTLLVFPVRALAPKFGILDVPCGR